jgi:Tfp pilus assembly protein PilO
LFRDINHLSQIAGTRNLRLEPAPVESLATLWRSPVSLSIEGSFPQLFEFVRGVELLSGWRAAHVNRDRSSHRQSRQFADEGNSNGLRGEAGFSGYAILAE